MATLGHYQLGRTLGQGSCGTVRHVRNLQSGEEFAAKILRHDRTDSEKLRREIEILGCLDFPHVVRLCDVLEEPGQTALILELAPGVGGAATAFELVAKCGRLLERQARGLFQQLIAALDHCHGKRIIHRDVKLENILLDAEANVKLADFGFAAVVEEGELLTRSCGSPKYFAPELLRREVLYQGEPVDIWAAGVVLYACLSGSLPFEGASHEELFARIRSGAYEDLLLVSTRASELLSRMLTADPSSRATVNKIVAHRWFQRDLPCDLRRSLRAKSANVAPLAAMTSRGFEVLGGISSGVRSRPARALASVSRALLRRCAKSMYGDAWPCLVTVLLLMGTSCQVA